MWILYISLVGFFLLYIIYHKNLIIKTPQNQVLNSTFICIPKLLTHACTSYEGKKKITRAYYLELPPPKDVMILFSISLLVPK